MIKDLFELCYEMNFDIVYIFISSAKTHPEEKSTKEFNWFWFNSIFFVFFIQFYRLKIIVFSSLIYRSNIFSFLAFSNIILSKFEHFNQLCPIVFCLLPYFAKQGDIILLPNVYQTRSCLMHFQWMSSTYCKFWNSGILNHPVIFQSTWLLLSRN